MTATRRQGRQTLYQTVMPNPESPSEKPWAILGIARKQYAAAKPWKKDGMSKDKYAGMLNMIPHEAMQILKDEAFREPHKLAQPLLPPGQQGGTGKKGGI